MKNFDQFIDSLFSTSEEKDLLDYFIVEEKNKTDFNIETIEEFKDLYECAYNKQQYIIREDKPKELKIGIKIINSTGIVRYFVPVKEIKKYLIQQKQTIKEKMMDELEKIVKEALEDKCSKLKEIYYFLTDEELRIIMIDNFIPKTIDGIVSPYYFKDDGFDVVLCTIRDYEWKKLELPKGWGNYENFIKYSF